MTIMLGAIVPHPPIAIPEIGGRELAKVRQTVEAFQELAGRVADSDPETVIIITPHGPIQREAVVLLADEHLQGDFGSFGAPGVSFNVENDTELVNAIEKVSREANLKTLLLKRRGSTIFRGETELDHGVTVPLYYLQKAGVKGRYLALTYSFSTYRTLFRFGQAVQKAVEKCERQTVVVASGDLSHRLTRGASSGYDPRGREFDEKLVGHLKAYEVEKILSMDVGLIRAAGECGMRSFAILFGCLSGFKIEPQVLSYEGPFGVGYLVASFIPRGKEVG